MSKTDIAAWIRGLKQEVDIGEAEYYAVHNDEILIELTGQAPNSAKDENVLTWGAGESVGGYAVQFAKPGGHQVTSTQQLFLQTTTSLPNNPRLQTPRYDPSIAAMTPFEYPLTTSGDGSSQLMLSSLLQKFGGAFASTMKDGIEHPQNVEQIYESFGNVTMNE
ncbi:hypothetical protein BJ878DRAFT_542925 [Calycina marina]|uniref:Uncharacterized protein n=1 Tax=Calycina marina TaxID=1763456 RepID=A0A9P7Z202_9HELO|nr:hypothetical protein BJ878DRAFT_542925 [Calycina marina]